jgi:hypothetical protein
MQLPLRVHTCDPDKQRPSITCAALGSGSGEVLDPDHRGTQVKPGEVLADTFDALLTRLENAFNAQARFIANASHELRTPLTVARTTLQIGLATTDPDRVDRVREELLRNNDHCIRLINGLLALARGEQGALRQDPVDLAEVVTEVIGELTAARRADGPRLQIGVPTRCTVLGDPVLLAQLVRNLVDNTLRYNVPGGEVHVELDTQGHLTISNTGHQITDDEVDRLFEPFREHGEIRTSAPTGQLGWIDTRDIAAAAEAALTIPDPASDYLLTGPKAVSYQEVAEIISAETGHPVRVSRISAESVEQDCRAAGVPPAFAAALAAVEGGIEAGKESQVSTAVLDLTGHSPRTFAEFVRGWSR